jgi:RNA polymerase sigma-70 factor (ECF subfamily)
MQGNHMSLLEYSQAVGVEITSDEMLARQVRRDPEAFVELYRRHVQRIYHFHLIRTSNVDDAHDLTSQTFMAALESIETYRGQGSFCGWLFGIASHKVADHYRGRRVDEPLEMAEALPDSDPSPSDVVAIRLQLVQVSEALRTLAPDQAEALTLRIFGELSAVEVGRMMGKSEAAVKMLVHRGLRKLREKLTLTPEVSL